MPDTGASRKRQIEVAQGISWRRRLKRGFRAKPARLRSGF
jgi:hypothetical protein